MKTAFRLLIAFLVIYALMSWQWLAAFKLAVIISLILYIPFFWEWILDVSHRIPTKKDAFVGVVFLVGGPFILWAFFKF